MAASERAGARPVFAYLPVYGEIPRTDEGMTSRERAFFAYCKDRGITAQCIAPGAQAALRSRCLSSPHPGVSP